LGFGRPWVNHLLFVLQEFCRQQFQTCYDKHFLTPHGHKDQLHNLLKELFVLCLEQGNLCRSTNLDFVLQATGWNDKVQRTHRINTVLEQVGLAGMQKSMPHQLSGGEQQRVVIARALVNSPEIILADEPTGNLDPDTSDDILMLLREISQKNNTAVLFATHDYRILETFPARIIRCVNGRIYDDQELGI
jgi:ABC-type ATPase involved in cell division